jgi:hypothetical protein
MSASEHRRGEQHHALDLLNSSRIAARLNNLRDQARDLRRRAVKAEPKLIPLCRRSAPELFELYGLTPEQAKVVLQPAVTVTGCGSGRRYFLSVVKADRFIEKEMATL